MTYFIIKWLLAGLAIVGVILNIKKKVACFYIWTVTNASWMAIDLYEGIYAQAFLFFIYWGLAVWGLFEWRKRAR